MARQDWLKLSPFEKTAVIAVSVEALLFVGVVAIPAVVVGRSYMLYWPVLGPPSLNFTPLLYRFFKRRGERLVVRHRPTALTRHSERDRDEAQN